MDRKLYKIPFREKRIPEWTCPTCSKSALKLKKDSFHSAETSSSKRARKHEEWDPDWIEYVYTCVLECSNESCGETVMSTGTGTLDMFDVTYDVRGMVESEEWDNRFRPKYFQPHLRPFPIPEETPEMVEYEIERSFELFFANPSSACSHLRVAIEELLTHLKISRYTVIRGKRQPISLHRRIGLLPDKYEELKEMLFAIKWNGNAGSHSHKEVTIDDVMDAYHIMEAVLEELFKNKRALAKKLAKAINQKKGPKGKK